MSLFAQNKNEDKKYYDSEGNLILEVHFEDGIPQGTINGYWPNGRLRFIIPLVEGKFEGMALYYSYKSNNIIIKAQYSEGKLMQLNQYYESGRINKKLELKDGVLNGLSVAFEDNLSMDTLCKGEYLNGFAHGEYVFYSKKGKIIERFKNGRCSGDRLSYENNKLIYREVYDVLENRYVQAQKIKNGKVKKVYQLEKNESRFIYGDFLDMLYLFKINDIPK